MDSSFPRLPIEIIDLIACHIGPRDLLALRLVCRTLSDKFIKHFARRWFTNLNTNLTPKSLSRLQGISCTEHLKERPQTLNIVHEADGYGQIELGRGFSWKREPSGRLCKSLEQPCVQQLQDVLLNHLTNCRSFRILGTKGVEDLYEEDRIWPSDAIGIVLNMIAETGLPIRSFWTDFNGNGIDAKRIDIGICRRPHHQRFRESWANIQELRIEHSPTLSSLSTSLASDLLTHALRLRNLSLTFGFDYCTEFLEEYLASDSKLPYLETLRLTCWHLPSQMLSELLSTSSLTCFRELHLKNVTLYPPNYDHDSDDGSTNTSWSDLLRGLRKQKFPHLAHISIVRVKELIHEDSGRLANVVFPSLFQLHLSKHDAGSTAAWERRTFHSFHVNEPSSAEEKNADEQQADTIDTLMLHHKRYKGQQRVMGVEYHGRHFDEALELITKSIEFMI